MAIRGAESKEYVTKKILEVFPEAFIADKTIRVPVNVEGDGVIQIKIALTAAKDIIEPPTGTAGSIATTPIPAATNSSTFAVSEDTTPPWEDITEEELSNTAKFARSLGF